MTIQPKTVWLDGIPELRIAHRLLIATGRHLELAEDQAVGGPEGTLEHPLPLAFQSALVRDDGGHGAPLRDLIAATVAAWPSFSPITSAPFFDLEKWAAYAETQGARFELYDLDSKVRGFAVRHDAIRPVGWWEIVKWKERAAASGGRLN